MKLKNFLNDESFDNLRSKMGGAELTDYESPHEWEKTTIGPGLDLKGEVEVPFNQLIVEDDKTFTLAGRKVLIYIRDQYAKYFPCRFHVANCSTLSKAQSEGRYERYVASIRTDGTFKVNVIHNNGFVESGQLEKLQVCKNCLEALNYQGYNLSYQLRPSIFASFDLKEFFNLYKRQAVKKPKNTDATAQPNLYPEDWSNISASYRRKVRYHCEGCNVNLDSNPGFLHVHHINSLKYDCRDQNLKALCIRCHADQPGHGHMFAHSDYNKFLGLYGKLSKY